MSLDPLTEHISIDFEHGDIHVNALVFNRIDDAYSAIKEAVQGLINRPIGIKFVDRVGDVWVFSFERTSSVVNKTTVRLMGQPITFSVSLEDINLDVLSQIYGGSKGTPPRKMLPE